ncbi:MAG: hypothetical protein ACJ74H_22085 [Thermoanaerobaculia bacterium]
MIYRVEPAFRRTIFLCGVFFAICATFGAAVVLFDRTGSLSSNIVLAAATAGFALAAFWCFRFARYAARYEVELTDYGIRVSGGEHVPWSDIVAVRERRVLQRLDLLDAAGVRRVQIEYQIENARGVIAEVRRRSRISETASSRTIFGNRRAASFISFNALVFLGLSALGIWVWLDQRYWVGLVLPPMMVWALYTDLRDSVRQVEVGEDSVIIRTFLREEAIPASEIAEVDLTLKPVGAQQILACGIALQDGDYRFLVPPGVDAVELTEAMRRLERRRLAG